MNEAQKIIEYLVSSGIKQAEIARLIGCSFENISRIVHGDKDGSRSLFELRALRQRMIQADITPTHPLTHTRRMAMQKKQAPAPVQNRPPAPVQATSQPRPPVVRSPQVVSISPANYLALLPQRLTAKDILKRFIPGNNEEVREEENEYSQAAQSEEVNYPPGTIPPNWPIGVRYEEPLQTPLTLSWPKQKRY